MKRSHIFGPFAISILAIACAPQEIVVADISALHDAAPDGPTPCATNDDCGDTEFCKKVGCDDLSGTCAVRRNDCSEDDGHTVCGCSGTNYWNECVAAQSGENIHANGDCAPAFVASCGGHAGTSCAVAGAFCAFLLPKGADPCGPPPPQGGKCWKLPDDLCNGHPGTLAWTQCLGDVPGCVDRCTAIRSQAVSVAFAMGCH